MMTRWLDLVNSNAYRVGAANHQPKITTVMCSTRTHGYEYRVDAASHQPKITTVMCTHTLAMSTGWTQQATSLNHHSDVHAYSG